MGIPFYKKEKLIQELAWRDYWQQIWIDKQNAISTDLKHSQSNVLHQQIPKAVLNANTGIKAVDEAIKQLYKTGHMHNHMRMYVASICCNIAKSHWLIPAKWMYAYLLDGDWASNALSWQWVAGTFSNKKYVANQDNINKYFNSSQKDTFLDVSYDAFNMMECPYELSKTIHPYFENHLPKTKNPELTFDKTTLIYNYYNLNPFWKQEEDVQRVLLLEPSFFTKYPTSQKSTDFAIALSKNIPNIQMYVGEFSDLLQWVSKDKIVYKEHPTNKHYIGKEEARDWISNVTGYYPSFFKFWKNVKKEIQN